MGAGTLVLAYAYEVAPRQLSNFVGGAVRVGAGLQSALDSTFDRSRLGSAPSVTFMVDTASPSRAHPIRDEALKVSFDGGDQTEAVQRLAARLGDSMDNRSKSSLLMVTVHEATTSGRRLILWTFPQQEVFNLRSSGGETRLELLEAFNRESSLRKAALLEGPNQSTGMLSARVLDLQSTAAERAVADLWIVKFLQARLQMSDAEGTQLLARSLRTAHTRTRDDSRAQDQINAAIAALRTSNQPRWSIDAVASTFLSGEASEAFLSHVRPEERGAAFGLDREKFDHLIQYKRFKLANGVIVSAPFVEIGSQGGVTITEVEGERRLQAEGVIEEEQVRTRG
jgi:hypothetical protein